MTALTAQRSRSQDVWKYRQFTLASGSKAYKGGQCVINPGTGKVIPASAAVGQISIGVFAETVDASSTGTNADTPINVDLVREVQLEWWPNSGSNAVAATDLGALCYMEDDNVVGISPIGFSLAGRVWGVDSVRGVAVERLSASAAPQLTQSPAVAFAANDLVIANNPVSGTLYDIPTTAGASTVTLPATSKKGTILYFKADGTKNGHTVQYRDGTGPVNLTTALTASKRHLCVAVFDGTSWFANAYVSP